MSDIYTSFTSFVVEHVTYGIKASIRCIGVCRYGNPDNLDKQAKGRRRRQLGVRDRLRPGRSSTEPAPLPADHSAKRFGNTASNTPRTRHVGGGASASHCALPICRRRRPRKCQDELRPGRRTGPAPGRDSAKCFGNAAMPRACATFVVVYAKIQHIAATPESARPL